MIKTHHKFIISSLVWVHLQLTCDRLSIEGSVKPVGSLWPTTTWTNNFYIFFQLMAIFGHIIWCQSSSVQESWSKICILKEHGKKLPPKKTNWVFMSFHDCLIILLNALFHPCLIILLHTIFHPMGKYHLYDTPEIYLTSLVYVWILFLFFKKFGKCFKECEASKLTLHK
jgi:hypothetical protein